MNNLIAEIKGTYLRRTSDNSLQKKIWRDVASFFRPDVKNYRVMRPSALIAKETGDLGLSVLWIVQTALARPVINDLALSSSKESSLISLIQGIDDFSICALAHSESKDSPVTIEKYDEAYKLNGRKKFITAGVNADFILITCRGSGEEKISRAVLLDKDSIPYSSMTDLNLEIMKSVNHTSLTLSSLHITDDKAPEVDSSSLRRSIKKWSLIERAMIIEAFIPFLIYFNRIAESKGLDIISEENLADLAAAQSNAVTKQLEEAFFSSRITTANIETGRLLEAINYFRKERDDLIHLLDEADRLKFEDIFIFDSIK